MSTATFASIDVHYAVNSCDQRCFVFALLHVEAKPFSVDVTWHIEVRK